MRPEPDAGKRRGRARSNLPVISLLLLVRVAARSRDIRVRVNTVRAAARISGVCGESTVVAEHLGAAACSLFSRERRLRTEGCDPGALGSRLWRKSR